MPAPGGDVRLAPATGGIGRPAISFRAAISDGYDSARRGLRQRRTRMAFGIQHLHLKTRDPKQTAQFYIDNFGATMKAEIPGRGFRLDLHGLQLNVTGLIASQNHEQHYGIEHVALETDDYAGTLAKLRANGVKILEEMANNGRHVCFLEAPDGAQMEVIEKM
jgi:catechol 2,3-dioxygenase-like lactoylglutathione lyase family enzyme